VPNDSPTTKAFISYRHVGPDHSLAHFLARYLLNNGSQVFIDSQMPPGANWPKEIESQLRSSTCFIVLMSKDSILSDMVRREIEIARELRQQAQTNI
jgi:hypothetical protein